MAETIFDAVAGSTNGQFQDFKPISVQSIEQAISSGRLILMIFAEALINSNLIGMSIAVPISSISTTTKHWQVSDAYNGGTDTHLQVDVNTTSITVRMFYGSAQQTLTSVNFIVI